MTILSPVFRFADDFKIVFDFQYPSKFPAHDPVVVREQDGDSFHRYGRATNIS
jgi:hypothetical protein